MNLAKEGWEKALEKCGLVRHFGPKGCGGMATRCPKASEIRRLGNGVIIHQEFGHWRTAAETFFSVSIQLVKDHQSIRILVYESAESRSLIGTKDHWVK